MRKKKYKDKKEYEFIRGLRRFRGMTLETYNQFIIEQNNLCAICEKPNDDLRKKRLCIDHNHHTNKIRGLLCDRCNTGLGKFLDDPHLLEAALIYLNRNGEYGCQGPE